MQITELCMARVVKFLCFIQKVGHVSVSLVFETAVKLFRSWMDFFRDRLFKKLTKQFPRYPGLWTYTKQCLDPSLKIFFIGSDSIFVLFQRLFLKFDFLPSKMVETQPPSHFVLLFQVLTFALVPLTSTCLMKKLTENNNVLKTTQHPQASFCALRMARLKLSSHL